MVKKGETTWDELISMGLAESKYGAFKAEFAKRKGYNLPENDESITGNAD